MKGREESEFPILTLVIQIMIMIVNELIYSPSI